MKIINGSGKIVNGKYEASQQDFLDNDTIINEFYEKALTSIQDTFGEVGDTRRSDQKYERHVQTAYMFIRPAKTVYLNCPNFKCDYFPLITLDTGLNENGFGRDVVGNVGVKRHYVISFALSGKLRHKYQKTWQNTTIVNKYILSDTMEDAIVQFEKWVARDWKYFMEERIHQNLEYWQDRNR